MLIDLKLTGKTVLIVGGGKVGERKARKFSEDGSKVITVSKDFTTGLKQLSKLGGVKLLKVKSTSPSISQLISKSDIVIAATDDDRLNEKIAKEAKKKKIMVCAVDNPKVSDFSLPATTKKGDVQIAIYTEGKSPAMASVLRKKVERMITKEDVLQVKLQDYTRKIVKKKIDDKNIRRNVLYRVIRDERIKRLLEAGQLNEAKNIAGQIVLRYRQSRGG